MVKEKQKKREGEEKEEKGRKREETDEINKCLLICCNFQETEMNCLEFFIRP